MHCAGKQLAVHGVRMSLLQVLMWHLCGNVLSTHFAMYVALLLYQALAKSSDSSFE